MFNPVIPWEAILIDFGEGKYMGGNVGLVSLVGTPGF